MIGAGALTGAALTGAAAAGAAAALLVRPPRVVPASGARADRPADERGWLRRGRTVWAGLGGLAAWSFVGGPVGAVVGLVVVAWVLHVAGRAEPPQTRRDREAARRDLPHLVGLLGDALRGGQPAVEALVLASTALPGPAAERITRLLPRLRLGIDPAQVWAELADDPDLGPLGRALGRAHESGAGAAASVERLAVDLAGRSRADVEDRARAVGVRAAIPLTLCLLPSFILLGIVPVVAGLLATLGL